MRFDFFKYFVHPVDFFNFIHPVFAKILCNIHKSTIIKSLLLKNWHHHHPISCHVSQIDRKLENSCQHQITCCSSSSSSTRARAFSLKLHFHTLLMERLKSDWLAFTGEKIAMWFICDKEYSTSSKRSHFNLKCYTFDAAK